MLFLYSGCEGLGPYQREPSKEGLFCRGWWMLPILKGERKVCIQRMTGEQEQATDGKGSRWASLWKNRRRGREKWRKGIRTDGAQITAEKRLKRTEGGRERQSVSD